MQLPIFFSEKTGALNEILTLDEDTSKHVVQVLRMQKGELLQLTDGKGNLVNGQIIDAFKKNSTVRIIEAQFIPRPERMTAIAISLLKNSNRFEWFLEKATELGIQEIVPLICDRTTRQHFRFERMQSLLVSAMLQSQQAWLPEFHEPVRFNKFMEGFQEPAEEAGEYQKFIAHCIDEDGKQDLRDLVNTSLNGIVLIGPEGDFSKEEIELAARHQFVPVSLGATRLRTETAGIVAATLLRS
ncbi:MAG: RsmE family RNA methyltransferase [Chitinophagaceae bacterium]